MSRVCLYRFFLSPVAEPERRPESDADAPGDLLLATAHAALLQPLSAHRARLAADVSGRLPLKNETFLDRNTQLKRVKRENGVGLTISRTARLHYERTPGQSTLQRSY